MKKKWFLVIPLCLAVFGTACSTAWVSTLDSILAAAAPALINILEIAAAANGSQVSPMLETKINTDAADLKQLAAAFAADGNSGNVCQDLTAAVNTYQGDLQLVLQVAQVSDPNTQTKIQLLSTLVAGTISAITAVIPSCGSAATAKAFNVTGPEPDVRNFVTSYNAILVRKTGNAKVDAKTSKLKIHQHSKFWRYASGGLLK
jgi:hypothetical protein